jgi:hypothetical protein
MTIFDREMTISNREMTTTLREMTMPRGRKAAKKHEKQCLLGKLL